MRRRRRVQVVPLLMLVSFLPTTRAEAKAEDADYARVSDADTALGNGDYASAAALLGLVGSDSPARADADQVRKKLERARAPVFLVETDVHIDDQPFARWGGSVEIKSWVAPRLELRAGLEAGSVLEPVELGFDGGMLAARLRLGGALVDVSAWGGARRWFDGRESFQGELSLGLFPTGKFRMRLGAGRADEMTTWRAIARHIHRDGGFAELELHSLGRFSGAFRGDLFRYSDRNAGVSLSAWLAIALIESPLRLDVGYAGSYRGTEASRWDAIASVYDPYFTPLQSFRHGPSASVSVRGSAVSASASAHYALFASERDPSTVGYYYSRRQTRHADLRASASLAVSDVVFSAGYQFLLESYYAGHEMVLLIHVPL